MITRSWPHRMQAHRMSRHYGSGRGWHAHRYGPLKRAIECVISLSALSIAGISAASSASAAPSSTCLGSRHEAKTLATNGTMTEPFGSVISAWTDQTPIDSVSITPVEDYQAHITFRYSAQYQCAWGLITLDRKWNTSWLSALDAPSVWLDVSDDQGQTISLSWTNEQVVNAGNSSTYTATFPTTAAGFSTPISLRACGHGEHQVFTIQPKFTRGAGTIGPALGTENRQDPTVCTPWLTTFP
jgi:hypothetical protein